jgi:hypothetical protein
MRVAESEGQHVLSHEGQHVVRRQALTGQRPIEEGGVRSDLAENRPVEQARPMLGHELSGSLPQAAHFVGREIELIHETLHDEAAL